MNMKKSIAGVMAGAMAVSAMATVVSADQDAISLNYDLKTYVKNVNSKSARVTVVANYEGSLVTAESVDAGYITFGADNSYVKKENIYNKSGVKIGDANYTGDLKEFEFTARPYKDVINNLEEKYQTFKATSEAKNVDGAYYDATLGGQSYNMRICTSGEYTIGKFDLRKYDIYNLGYSTTDGEDGKASSAEAAGLTKLLGTKTVTTTEQGALISTGYYMKGEDGELIEVDVKDKDLTKIGDGVYTMEIADEGTTVKVYKIDVYDEIEVTKTVPNTVEPGTFAVRDAVAKLTYEIPNTVNLNKANGWGWDYDYTMGNFDENDMEHITNQYFYDTLMTDMVMSAEIFAGGFFDANGTKRGMIKPDTALASTPTTVAVGAFTAGEAIDIKVPFKTTLKPQKWYWTFVDANGEEKTIYTPDNDVIAALENRKENGQYYTRPLAVINDAIANHENVTFTFKSYDGYVATEKSKFMNQWVHVGAGYDYETSGKGYDWHNPTFGQHLYTNVDDSYALMDVDITDYDKYGSYSSAWMINLFTGAVVVNKDITMQLSDTDAFEWGTNTLTFEWFDITDAGKITDAKTFLTSMLLYTPVDWYWDTLSIVVSDDEEEAIDAGEGLDGEGDVIDDEEPADIEDLEIEEPEIEEPEVVETEAAPVETAPSPATGNAPVALAVIPVALAAAAVVAKKRG